MTIGSDNAPIVGALLELRENGVTNKGLGMSRVYLTDQDNLFPMFDIGANDYSATNKDTNDKEHIGLMVYNTNKCLNFAGIDDGLYVWSGDSWDKLFNSKKSPEVEEYTDQEGNKFLARKFGNAGIWMLQNLAVKKYADGTSIPLHDGTMQTAIPAYAYPSQTGGGWKKPVVNEKRLGFLYNWRQPQIRRKMEPIEDKVQLRKLRELMK